jgi:hypothetical protein
MIRPVSKQSGNVARIALAIALAAAFVCAALPLASVSASNACHLECCAARAPHAAGSCLNGSCHAAIGPHQKKSGRSIQLAPAEEFCGLKRLAISTAYRPIPTGLNASQSTVATVTAPCDAGCGSFAAGSVSAKDKIATVARYQLQPLSADWSTDSGRISSDQFSHRQYSPRGPPANAN